MKRTKQKALTLLLALCVTLGLLPALTPAANAADAVTYLDATVGADNTVTFTEKTCDSYVAVASGLTAWNAGWYVADGEVTIADCVTVSGEVKLILKDGAKLTASGGINVNSGNSLTIYAQSEGESMGKLSATGGSRQAGIGGGAYGAGGTITVNGGAVTATGTGGAAGIGGGDYGAGGTITVNGGAVTATSTGGAGIGGGNGRFGGTITVNGGTVRATGGNGGAGIGGGYGAAGGTITVNGGTVMANGGKRGAGIGGGKGGAGGAISITGGTVNANGNVGGGSSEGGAGIGGGESGNNSGDGNSISITGGTVTATVSVGIGAAIGNGGGTGTNCAVTIGANVTVEAGASADGTGATSKTAADVANNKNYKYAIVCPVVNVSGVTLDQTSLNLTVGGNTATLMANIEPSNASYKTVTWASSDTAVATVSNGVVTPVAAGTATITATATNGTTDTSDDKTATCTVTVSTVSVTGVTLDQTSLSLTVGGSTGTLGATVEPTDASYKTVTWASDNEAVATVDDSGVVTPVAAGTATITVTATNGTTDTADDKTATCTVTVIPSYAVKAADTVTGTDKKYHYNEEITIAVTVSGADFEGGEFTLNYDSDTLQAPNPLPANWSSVTGATNKVHFSARTTEKITNGQLATITFTVKTKVSEETTCNFTFEGTPKICYDTDKDSVEAATVTTGSVIVEPVTYAVTLTGNDGVTFVNASNQTITTDTAIDVRDYSVNIKDYSAVDYEYAVTLAVEGTQGTTTLAPSDTGVITVDKDNITGNLTITVTRTTKHVTATLTASPTGEFTLSGLTTKPDTTTVTDAIKGLNYVVTISDYDAANYAYAVTLTMNGASATAPTPDTDGKLTIEGDDITGDFTLTVTRTTKHVTATLEGGLLSGSTDAIKGVDYTATISDYDANNYTYAVTLTMNNASADDKATMSGGTITIDGDDITGDFTLTVTKTLANFEVAVVHDYVSGWTLVTVKKTDANTDNPVYNYDGNAMYYVETYGAYAYLVEKKADEDALTVETATPKVSLGTSAAGTIAASEQYDVNHTNKVDYSDVLLTYRCYVKAHQTPATAMETYLRADVNGSKKVDTTDVSAIDSNRTPETT